MRHLFNSQVEVLRWAVVMENGVPTGSWERVDTILDRRLGVSGELRCRLDLNFLRPGKDLPAPAVAGRSMDRVGLMLFSADVALRSGDRIRCVSGPIDGTFELRNNPDAAAGYGPARHHFEVQVIEVAQKNEQAMRVMHDGQ